METNNPGKQMQLTLALPPTNCNNKIKNKKNVGLAAERRTQQWLWEINNKEHRAAWPLPPLAANQSPAPISEHVPRAKLAPYTEQEQERRDGIWLSHMMVVRVSASPPLKAFLPLAARRLFQHLHTCSRLSALFFVRRLEKKETRITFLCRPTLLPNCEGAAFGLLRPTSSSTGSVSGRHKEPRWHWHPTVLTPQGSTSLSDAVGESYKR